jgi:hypothetical protein
VEPKFIVDISLSVPPVPHALQFDEQFINRISIAAMFDRIVAELKQATDHQVMFCGG